MPTLRHQDVTLHYRTWGRGAPLLLLHSRGASAEQWRHLAPLLAERWTVLAPELHGHGKTTPWPGSSPVTHDDEAALVATLLEGQTRPCHVLGHSYGGGVALRLAVRWPARVRSLILYEPMAMPLLAEAGETELFEQHARTGDRLVEAAAAGDPARGWAQFINYSQGDGTWEAMGPAQRARVLASTDAVVRGLAASRAPSTTLAEVRALRLPVLVLCGARTRAPLAALTRLLARELPGATWQELPEAGHMGPLTHARPVAERIISFLTAHEASAGG